MDAETWNDIVESMQEPHILQTWEWGQVKEQHGWKMLPRTWQNTSGEYQAAAMVLQRTIRPAKFGAALRVLYVPRGPLVNWEDPDWRWQVVEDLQALARQQKAIFIKIDPELVNGVGIPGQPGTEENEQGQQVESGLSTRGWIYSADQIQFRNTVWLDLRGNEEDWLERMKQKGRYNVRLSQKKGVSVRIASKDELPLLYKMYAETSIRDGFVIRSQEYYLSVWQKFIRARKATPFLAEVDGQPVAGLVLFHFARKAWYLYGMSTGQHREKMPNSLLQWTAMQRAKDLDCRMYDLWGAPDEFNESDSMWGVYRFKEALGGKVIRTIGAWDYTPYPNLYKLYTSLLPRLLDILRRRGKDKTRREVSL